MKTRIYVLFFFLCFGNVHFSYSQSFQRLFGTRNSDNFSSIVLLSNGDYIVTGTTVRVGAGTDIYVTRVDNTGSIVWENTYGGIGNEDNSISCLNNNGNIIIAASSSSYNGNRDLDIFIFEITTNGLVNWSRTYGKGSSNNNLDEIPRKINLSQTGLILCATIGSPGSLSPDALAFELSNNGQNINWQNQIGITGNYGDIPSSIISDQFGRYVMVGGSYTIQNNYDQVIWQLNSNGSLQNNIAFGSAGNENAQDVIMSNGNIMVMGNFRNISGSGLEFSLSSINPSNTFNWIKTYGDNNTRDERAYGFTKTLKGYALCGYTNGRAGNDILLIWTNNQGKLLGSTSIGESGKEESSSVIQNSDSSFTIAGVSSSKSVGLDDCYLVRTKDNGVVDKNCSSYNIVERTIGINMRSNSYSQSDPQLLNNIINLIITKIALTDEDLVCATLPLELIDFKISLKDNNNKLTWISLNEHNLSHFDIERSYDCENWKSIKLMISESDGDESKIYSFIDSEKGNACSYYRLKQVDYDGVYSYSKILKSCSYINELFVYPNPTKSILSINGLFLDEGTLLYVAIKKINGIEVFKEKFTKDNIVNGELVVDLNNFDSGIYIMSLIYQDKNITMRVIKE